jgi:hypothetical protein
MPADNHMRAVGRGRRQPPLELFRARLETFLEARRERPTTHKLLFQAGRQPILLRKPGGELVPMLTIPLT